MQQILFETEAAVPVRPGAPPLLIPTGGFGCQVADPPWPYRDSVRRELPYATMTEADLLRFAQDVLRRAGAADSHLWMWVVDAHLGLACEMIAAAGYTTVSTIPWVKTAGDVGAQVVLREFCVKWISELTLYRAIDRSKDIESMHTELSELLVNTRLKIGGGHYVRHAHELAILAVRGGATAPDRSVSSVIFAPLGAHSAKPEELQNRAERVSPGPRVEYFARRQRAGWACWGLECPAEVRP